MADKDHQVLQLIRAARSLIGVAADTQSWLRRQEKLEAADKRLAEADRLLRTGTPCPSIST